MELKFYMAVEVPFTTRNISNSDRSIKWSISGSSIKISNLHFCFHCNPIWNCSLRPIVANHRLSSPNISRKRSRRWPIHRNITSTSLCSSMTIGISSINLTFCSNLSVFSRRTNPFLTSICTSFSPISRLELISPNRWNHLSIRSPFTTRRFNILWNYRWESRWFH